MHQRAARIQSDTIDAILKVNRTIGEHICIPIAASLYRKSIHIFTIAFDSRNRLDTT